jgi:hypothetical protein
LFVEQAFHPSLVTIFAGVRAGDISELRIPLVFMPEDADVQKWVDIEIEYLAGRLPDASGLLDLEGKQERKPLSQFDFKTLYGLRPEDINHLACEVAGGRISVKSGSLGKKGQNVTSKITTLQVAGARIRVIRAMKTELLSHYKGYLLP